MEIISHIIYLFSYILFFFFFFFNDTATTEIYTLSLHDALPISFRNAVYAFMSNGLPLLARCQPSIFACKVSRTASNSAFFGARFSRMAASPAQNASGEIPVFGVASLAIKSNKTGAIFNPWASIRFMIGFFLTRNGGYAVLGKRQ